MKQIDKTEAYNQAMQGIQICYSGIKGLATLKTDVRFRQCLTVESKVLNDHEAMQRALNDLAWNMVRSILRQCGISDCDISLLEIAKELAAEDDCEGVR